MNDHEKYGSQIVTVDKDTISDKKTKDFEDIQNFHPSEKTVWIDELPESLAHSAKSFLKELNTISKLIQQPSPPKNLQKLQERVALLSYILENPEKLQELITANGNIEAFAYPTNNDVESVLELFKSNRRTSLEKPKETIKHSLQQSYKNSSKAECRVLIHNRPTQTVEAVFDPKPFYAIMDQENLAESIIKAYGDEGLRHFYAILIVLGKNYDKKQFEWKLETHLELLGYTKGPWRSYATTIKVMASNIIRIFTQFRPILTKKIGNKESIVYRCLFTAPELEIFDKKIITRITLQPTEWYTKSFSGGVEKSPQYIELLEKIAKVNHKNHWLALRLYPYIARLWRINLGAVELKVETILEQHDLKTQGRYRLKNLLFLESELDYMSEEGFIGNWKNKNGESKYPSECANPYKCVLVFELPLWLISEFDILKQKRAAPIIRSLPSPAPISREKFIQIFKNSGCNLTQFASSIGFSRRLVKKIIDGEVRISLRVSDKVQQIYLLTGIHYQNAISENL